MKVNLQKKLGQNTAEYLIMLVLIAGGSIGIFTVFGNTIRQHLGNVVSAFGGSSDNWTEDVKATANKGGEIGTKAVGMGGLKKDETVPTIGAGN